MIVQVVRQPLFSKPYLGGLWHWIAYKRWAAVAGSRTSSMIGVWVTAALQLFA
jgi:hypothetical protein